MKTNADVFAKTHGYQEHRAGGFRDKTPLQIHISDSWDHYTYPTSIKSRARIKALLIRGAGIKESFQALII